MIPIESSALFFCTMPCAYTYIYYEPRKDVPLKIPTLLYNILKTNSLWNKSNRRKSEISEFLQDFNII